MGKMLIFDGNRKTSQEYEPRGAYASLLCALHVEKGQEKTRRLVLLGEKELLSTLRPTLLQGCVP